MTTELPSSDLRDYFDVLIRRWKLVVAVAVLATAAAVAAGLMTPPTFEATATIALAPATLSIPTANQVPPYYLMVNSARQLPTAFTPTYYVALLKGADVVNAVAPDVAVSIAPNAGDKSLIEITARGSDAGLVAQTANKWAQVGAARIAAALVPNGEQTGIALKALDAADQALVKFCTDNGLDYDLAKLRSGLSLSTDKRLELARLVRNRDNAEAVFNGLQRDYDEESILAASTLKPATINAQVPSTPSGPKWAQTAGLAAGLGLLVGVLGAFAIEYLNRKP